MHGWIIRVRLFGQPELVRVGDGLCDARPSATLAAFNSRMAPTQSIFQVVAPLGRMVEVIDDVGIGERREYPVEEVANCFNRFPPTRKRGN